MYKLLKLNYYFSMKLIIKGFIIGIAKIIPGVSGSMLAITLNVYDKALDCICNFTKNKKENIKFLTLLSLGIISSIIVFSKIIKYSLSNYYLITILLFIGLIIGSTKKFSEEIKLNKNSVILIIVSFILSLIGTLLYIDNSYILRNNYIDKIMIFISGFIESLSSIVPGVSGTMLLMTFGTYNIVINIISNLTNINFIVNNFLLILIFFLGTFLGVIITSLMMKKLLNKYKNSTYSFILGLCVANIIVLIIKTFKIEYTFIELIIGLIMAIIGYILGIIL